MQQSHGNISTSERELRLLGPAARSPTPDRWGRAWPVSGEPAVDLGVVNIGDDMDGDMCNTPGD